MHHFVVKFLTFSSPQAARGIAPLTKILQTFLVGMAVSCHNYHHIYIHTYNHLITRTIVKRKA